MLFGMKISVLGTESIPAQGCFILIANHRSSLDAMVISSVVPRYISWLVADYNLESFWNRQLFESTGMIPVAVGGVLTKRSLTKMHNVLKSGEVLGIFPEGQDYILNGRYDEGPAPFHKGFAFLAHKYEVPVLPCVLKPQREVLKPLKVPNRLRQKVEEKYDLTLPEKHIKYKRVTLHFGELITPGKFMVYSREWLVDHAREQMVGMWEQEL